MDRDGNGGELYNRDREKLDDMDFLARSKHDPHQFRIILSPEDGEQIGDLKAFTRDVMTQAEKDLGTKLDWVAVDHWNTGHPHTHVVIRGRDAKARDLVIAREYLTRGFRARAQEIALARLGPRRDLEIARARAREVEAERFTGIDRELAALARGDTLEIAPSSGGAEQFERTLHLRRLKFLESLGLAVKESAVKWRLANGWEEILRKKAIVRDIIRSISAAAGKEIAGRDLAAYDGGAPPKIIGRVAASAPDDEMRDTRLLVVEAGDGKFWRVAAGVAPPGALPPQGAIVELGKREARPLASDRAIARIAELNRGLYSKALHEADDPSASKAFIEAHKRRLEALRRASMVMREADGSWRIGEDYLERAAHYEAARGGRAQVDVKSWVDLDAQIEARAPVWLDEIAGQEFGENSLGADIAAARTRRAAFLKREGLWSEDAGGIAPGERETLAAGELESAAAKEARRTGKTYRAMTAGVPFEGVYERPVDLGQGRFALIARAKEFTLVPWRPGLERIRGRQALLRRTPNSISWTFDSARGIGR
ncbi:MAG: conjugal transfer protein TraI [Hyphococcus sp.]|nr:MAG: conjugal transfer protein TraI [Marinicaulis sp.]